MQAFSEKKQDSRRQMMTNDIAFKILGVVDDKKGGIRKGVPQVLKHRSTGSPMGRLKFEGVRNGYRCGT